MYGEPPEKGFDEPCVIESNVDPGVTLETGLGICIGGGTIHPCGIHVEYHVLESIEASEKFLNQANEGPFNSLYDNHGLPVSGTVHRLGTTARPVQRWTSD